MSKVYTCELIQDPDDPNELAIDLPDELLVSTGWKPGDVILWKEVDGSWILSKKISQGEV